ncbi:MAG: hypothetical protein WC547_08380, partial [Candidatus Omnitrophota bacterium]
MAPFSKNTAASKVIIFAIIASFILSSVPQGFCFNNTPVDHLRADSLKNSGADLDLFKTSLKDGGTAVDYDLYEKAKIELSKTGPTVLIYEYNKRKNEYVAKEQKKKVLAHLFARDEVGLIEDEGNPGTFIWAKKKDGAVVTKNGDLFISGRFSFPAMEDVPEGRVDYNRYTKIVPLAYGFFKAYLGKGEYAWMSDVLTQSKIYLTDKNVGPRHYTIDKESRKLVIERDFMDYLLHAGNKRVGMSIFAQAAAELSDKNLSQDQVQQFVDMIAQKSLVSRNRLEDSIHLYGLITGVDERAIKLTAQERQYYFLDIMERNRSLNGRRAAKMLKEQFGYYGKITAAQAEADLRAIVKAHPAEMVIDKFDPKKEKEETKKIKFFDRTDAFRLNGRHMADTNLIKDRRVVTDYEVDARDAFLFGGKVAYTGMMQWAPHVLTLPMFATAGSCFRDDLIKESGLTEKFHGFAKELEDGVKALDAQYGKDSKDKEFLTKRSKLIDDTARKFQSELEWGTAKISSQLVKEIKESLVELSGRTGIPLFQLILAIRSSAIGE